MRNSERHAGTIADRAALLDRQPHDMGRDQQPAARVDVEGAAMDAAGVDMLDRVGLAGRGVDRINRERVFAAGKDALRPLPDRARGAVRDIDKAAVRMDMDRAGGLAPADVAGLGQGALAEQRRRRKPAAVDREHVEPVLPLQRHIDPWLCRMKIEMARAKPIAAARRHRNLAGQQPVLVAEHLQRARLLGLAGGGVMAAGDQNRQPVVEADPHLMPVDAGVDRLRLRDLGAGREVGVDPIDLEPARIAERHQ